MILLGLILILLGAALGLVTYLAATPSSQTVELSEFGFTRASSALELLVIGAVAMLLIWLGWSAMAATMRRRSRLRREEREQERYAELERKHEDFRTENDRRFEEARLRDEDLVRREEQVETRQAEIDLREAELARRETAWRDRPSVADVVTGRAQGSVAQGNAQWADDRATRPVGASTTDELRTEQTRVDHRPGDETPAEAPAEDARVAAAQDDEVDPDRAGRRTDHA